MRGIHRSRSIPPQRPVTRSFDVFYDMRLNKQLSKQSRRRWFETPSRSLWRHHNGHSKCICMSSSNLVIHSKDVCLRSWNTLNTIIYHDDVIKWRYFPRYWSFVLGIHRPGEFPQQRPVPRSFDVFFDLRLNKPLSKQSWGWWFETSSCSLWSHCNVWQISIFSDQTNTYPLSVCDWDRVISSCGIHF